MSTDPALRFWLDWAEFRGAACEPQTDLHLVLLPTAIAATLGLPEELAVTADPEVAREDGAVLITAGHPGLDHAAEEVLGLGDTGHQVLAAPAGKALTPPDLLARARDAFPVEHGRLDLTGQPARRLVPVLRVGALLTHRLSVHDRFQERAEVWVDGATGAVLSDRLRDRLAQAAPEPVTAIPPLSEGLDSAMAAACQLLEQRAAGRRQVLAAEVAGMQAAELSRTKAYYDALLDTLASRRATASPEKAAGYAAREEATRAERVRRLAEVEEAYRPRTEVRPFRLHLLWAPALVLPVDVQRGAQRYPLELVWMLLGGGFLPRPCPSCGAASPLVATKQRLGCQVCVAVSAPPVPAPAPAPPPPAPAAPAPAQAPRSPTTGRPATPHATSPAARGPAPARRPANTARSAPASQPRTVAPRTLERQTLAFWQAVAHGERQLRRFVAADSPLAALRRLYGAAAPQVAVGLPPDQPMVSVGTGYLDGAVGQVTSGTVETRSGEYGYALRWQTDSGRAVVQEAMPSNWTHLGELPQLSWLPPAVRAMMFAPPQIRAELDPVAAQVWSAVVAADGLPLAARCLAGWWQAQPSVGAALEDQPAVTAAALAYEIHRRIRPTGTYREAAACYQVEEAALRRAVATLRPALRR